ncbi:hypothetical protein GHT06_017301 [Daphnia sinensis]|uniref:MYND-type domain-containing protein n=1 Tax=Daphnia sinensis TaxID=1820382 RepID=A0AAD5PTQ6_9CRUS|nr:hypothetical protein GHT06_017301 [Daphnia sinensis]
MVFGLQLMTTWKGYVETSIHGTSHENEEGQIRPIFIPNSCHVCKAMRHESEPSSEIKLLSCSGCRMIAYCGLAHQKEHWAQHKDFCKVVQQVLRKEGRPSLFSDVSKLNLSSESWKAFRYNLMVRVEKSLTRPMQPYEQEMFLYPRVCDQCRMDDGTKLNECSGCHSFFYCCDQHQSKSHEEWCKDLKLLLDLNIEQSKKGRIDCMLPHKLLENFEEFPPSLKEFLVLRMVGAMGAFAMGRNSLTLLTEFASYPLTVVWGLQEAAKLTDGIPLLSDRKSLVVHIVGAELPFECNNLAKWDVFFLNTLPALKSLYITFTGPELTGVPSGTWDDDLRCPHCERNNKHFICDFQPNTFYHDFVKSKNYIRPDVVVAFNCGLYRQTGFQGSDSWAKTIPCLLKEGVPLILTAYTAAEAPLDLKRLQDVSREPLEILMPPQKNPYRSSRPCRNFVSEEESPIIFKNQYITVVRKKCAK